MTQRLLLGYIGYTPCMKSTSITVNVSPLLSTEDLCSKMDTITAVILIVVVYAIISLLKNCIYIVHQAEGS